MRYQSVVNRDRIKPKFQWYGNRVTGKAGWSIGSTMRYLPLCDRDVWRLGYVVGLIMVLASGGCSAPSAPDNNTTSKQALRAGTTLPQLLDCSRKQGLTLLQAHRAGDRPGAAENSIAAIEASLADGALFIEMDVAQSADGVLVLMHDDTIDRTTTGDGRVDMLPYDALRRVRLVDVAGNETEDTVPSLAEVLKLLDGRGFAQIDRKRSVSFEAIAQALETAQAVDNVVVITYSIEDAIDLHRRLPTVMISTGIRSLDDVAALTSAGVSLDRIAAWLGLGSGNPQLDQQLAVRGIETSYGDFRAERDGTVDYQQMARNGAEVLSVDDVPAASNALDTREQLARLYAACR